MSLKEPCREGQERNKLSQVLETDNSEKSLSMFVYLSIFRHLIYPACFILTGLLFFLERFWRHGELPPPPLTLWGWVPQSFYDFRVPQGLPRLQGSWLRGATFRQSEILEILRILWTYFDLCNFAFVGSLYPYKCFYVALWELPHSDANIRGQ